VSISGADIKPTAAGVGVAGGRIGLDVLFLFGVDGPASLPFVTGSEVSSATFLFILTLATFGGGDLFVRSSLIDEAVLKRVDLLVDIVKLAMVVFKRKGHRSQNRAKI